MNPCKASTLIINATIFVASRPFEADRDKYGKLPGGPMEARFLKQMREMLVDLGSFNTFLVLLERSGAIEHLESGQPHTVLAPTDNSLLRLPPGAIDDLLEREDDLRSLVNLHIIPGIIHSSQMEREGELSTISDGTLIVIRLGDELQVNENVILAKDIEYANGLIHAIDGLLLPRNIRLQSPPTF